MEWNAGPEEEAAAMGAGRAAKRQAGPWRARSPESDPKGSIRVTPFFLGLLQISSTCKPATTSPGPAPISSSSFTGWTPVSWSAPLALIKGSGGVTPAKPARGSHPPHLTTAVSLGSHPSPQAAGCSCCSLDLGHAAPWLDCSSPPPCTTTIPFSVRPTPT